MLVELELGLKAGEVSFFFSSVRLANKSWLKVLLADLL